MSKFIVYDDTFSAPAEILSLLGVRRFSEVYYRKRSLERWMAAIADKAGLVLVALHDERSRTQMDRLAQLGGRLTLLYMPAYMAFACAEENAVLFLRRLSFSRTSLGVYDETARTNRPTLKLALLEGDAARRFAAALSAGEDAEFLLGEEQGSLEPVQDDVGIIDMRDPMHFTDYLTSNFDVRFFNSVQTVNDFVVLKRSTQKDKLRGEHALYRLLPDSMRMFFIQPYDYQEEAGSASYKMERLFVPDMALQWIHGSVDEVDMNRFLDKIFYFLSIRPVRRPTSGEAQAVHDDAYRQKVSRRLEEFKAQPEFQVILPHVASAFGSIDALYARYFRLLDTRNPKAVELRVGHGDLGFSNILYSKSTGILRLIDPRGAEKEEDLYMDPHYDLAKLSHSICGNYDFINHGLFRLDVGARLQVQLVIDPAPPLWARPLFEERLAAHGFSASLIRLYEASLFLSMVPLHIDSPKKVLAFLLNAGQILKEIEEYA